MNAPRYCFLALIVVSSLTPQAVYSADELLNLAPYGSFEGDVGEFFGWIPLGVVVEDESLQVEIVEGDAYAGEKALQIVPGPAGLVSGVVHYADYNSGKASGKFRRRAGFTVCALLRCGWSQA